jgi:hypothetical protein
LPTLFESDCRIFAPVYRALQHGIRGYVEFGALMGFFAVDGRQLIRSFFEAAWDSQQRHFISIRASILI